MTGLITQGSQPDCRSLPAQGTRARLILINYDDVSQVFTLNDKVTHIELRPGTRAYEFIGFRSDVGKIDEVVKSGRLKNRFSHACSFVVYDVSQAQKNNLKRLVRGRVMAIVENKGMGTDSIELLGRNAGLSVPSSTVRQEQNVFTIALNSPGGFEYERKLPQTLGISYGDGLAIIDELLGGVSAPAEDEAGFTIGFTIGFNA